MKAATAMEHNLETVKSASSSRSAWHLFVLDQQHSHAVESKFGRHCFVVYFESTH